MNTFMDKYVNHNNQNDIIWIISSHNYISKIIQKSVVSNLKKFGQLE